MQEEQLSKEVMALIAKVIKIPESKIDPNADLFQDLGVDSLLGVEIFASLDKKYGLNVPEEKLKNVSSVNDIIAMVKELLKNKK